jgi:hypothetical protein
MAERRKKASCLTSYGQPALATIILRAESIRSPPLAAQGQTAENR